MQFPGTEAILCGASFTIGSRQVQKCSTLPCLMKWMKGRQSSKSLQRLNAGFIIKHNLPFPKNQPKRFSEQSFNVERVRERAWIVERCFGKIDITINDTAISKMTIYRKENHGVFQELKTIHREELQDNTYTYIDEFLAEDKNYTYMLAAFEINGIPVGFSDRKTI